MSTPPKILVIDDDEAILDALDAVLQDEGYQTDVSTKDGEYVDYVLQRELPDLIILDILLSGHDGRDICKKIKNDERTSHIPIILMSAHIRGEDAAHQAGADAFLAKPFDINELLDKIARLL
ncbi:MAG: response regulator [Chloroflexota bacterium]